MLSYFTLCTCFLLEFWSTPLLFSFSLELENEKRKNKCTKSQQSGRESFVKLLVDFKEEILEQPPGVPEALVPSSELYCLPHLLDLPPKSDKQHLT